MNSKWHEKNRMPKNATLRQRAAWHVRHQKNCGCRPIPKGVRSYIKKMRQ